VFIDCLVGLFGIAIIGSLAVALQWKNVQIQQYGKFMAILVFVIVLVSSIYFSRTLRRLFKVDYVLERIPLGEKIKKIEAKIFAYRNHKKVIFLAFLITGVIQGSFILLNYILSLSLGLAPGNMGPFFVFLPIIAVLIAFPISFGGFGLREFLFVKFFRIFSFDPGIGFATSLLQGMIVLIWSLVGGLALLSLKKEIKKINQV
jgi:hypothetical protein